MSTHSGINVLFIASEADPFIKVGGLADVAGSLPIALKGMNRTDFTGAVDIDIRLVIPFHPQIRREFFSPQLIAEFPIRSRRAEILARIFALDHEGLPVYLVAGDPIDQESGVYSANLEDDGYKYVFFSMACLELARKLAWQPDILHANDWHTAAAVYALALQRHADPYLAHTRSLLTVHNLPYLGSMTPPAMQAFGLPEAVDSDLPTWARQMALPLGLFAADQIVAVSPGYAQEIITEEFGSGLQDFLRAHVAKLCGILNGLDTQKWDPATDRHLVANFSTENVDARTDNKTALQAELGLEINPHIPVLAMVTRIDPQKGVDLATTAIRTLLQSAEPGALSIQVVLLGTGNPVLEAQVRLLERDFPQSVCARFQFNEPLSHRIYAGADILLMPSRYEPCGLSQMIAMHYGCIPIARSTGGLRDTIHDPADTPQSTGFLFTPARPEDLLHAIRRALVLYAQNPTEWRGIQLRGMQTDFSWALSAQQYLKQYQSLLARGIKV